MLQACLPRQSPLLSHTLTTHTHTHHTQTHTHKHTHTHFPKPRTVRHLPSPKSRQLISGPRFATIMLGLGLARHTSTVEHCFRRDRGAHELHTVPNPVSDCSHAHNLMDRFATPCLPTACFSRRLVAVVLAEGCCQRGSAPLGSPGRHGWDWGDGHSTSARSRTRPRSSDVRPLPLRYAPGAAGRSPWTLVLPSRYCGAGGHYKGASPLGPPIVCNLSSLA